MPQLTSEIVLEPLGEGRTRARYSASVSPGGWVPNWIVPFVSHSLPRRTLAALARCAATPRHADAAGSLAVALGWEAAPHHR